MLGLEAAFDIEATKREVIDQILRLEITHCVCLFLLPITNTYLEYNLYNLNRSMKFEPNSMMLLFSFSRFHDVCYLVFSRRLFLLSYINLSA